MPKIDESLVNISKDPFIGFMKKNIVLCIKVLAFLMMIVIWLSLVDVIYHLYDLTLTHNISNIFYPESLLSILGDFLAVLIAVEIFLNILFFLRKDSIHVPLVISTALTAAARKVIIVDSLKIDPFYLIALACVILALGVSYWLTASLNSND